MDSFDSQRQNSLKGRWQERRLLSVIDNHNHNHHRHHHHQRRRSASSSFYSRVLVGTSSSTAAAPSPTFMGNPNNLQSFAGGGFDDHDHNHDRDHNFFSTVVPPVTVVLEGRAICQRISLHKHAGYKSLAKALRQMFVADGRGDAGVMSATTTSDDDHSDIDLSNAVPGHLVAYEDMENDLLLVGDLNWKDFVRVAKRIRILPVKANSRKGRG